MALFNKMTEPIVLKEDSEAEKQLEILKGLRPSFSGAKLDRLEREIKLVEAGIAGEKTIMFELCVSKMAMPGKNSKRFFYEALILYERINRNEPQVL